MNKKSRQKFKYLANEKFLRRNFKKIFTETNKTTFLAMLEPDVNLGSLKLKLNKIAKQTCPKKVPFL